MRPIPHDAGMKRGNLIPDLVVLILCGLALIKAVQTMGDLRWPYDLDQFREIGMAQSILDHRYGTDHLYAGETIWYNPLTSAAIAAVSYLTATPAPLVVTRAAAYLNLLAPLAFYIFFCSIAGGRWRQPPHFCLRPSVKTNPLVPRRIRPGSSVRILPRDFFIWRWPVMAKRWHPAHGRGASQREFCLASLFLDIPRRLSCWD